MKIRNVGALLVLACLSSNPGLVAAEIDVGDAVQLDELKVFTTTNIHGNCGDASVTIKAVKRSSPDSFYFGGHDAFITGDQFASGEAEITVFEEGKEQRTTVIHLAEYSFLDCLTTKTGNKIVIGTVCGGNHFSCAEPNYYLINADRITDIDTDDGCDTKCINARLGMDFIKR